MNVTMLLFKSVIVVVGSSRRRNKTFTLEKVNNYFIFLVQRFLYGQIIRERL